MAVATLVVTVLPGLVAAALQATGVIHGWLPSAAIAVVLSMALAAAGSAWWSRRPESRDLVFADLMLWGWLRRVRTERRLASARGLLGSSADFDPARKAALLERMTSALESRDAYTHGHSRRVTRHSYEIARQLGLPAADAARVRTAAALHDVGKIETPREVLNKPARLTDEEFAVMKRHPVDGAEMVAVLGDEELTAIVRHHHERLDGGGYPEGLLGEAIPLGARIIAVADTFDALTSNRPYRPSCRHKQALDVVRAEAGRQLDADVVAAFVSYYSGRRALPWWSAVAAAPSRLGSWLLGGIQGATAAPLGGGVTSLGAAFLVGASMAGSPTAGEAAGTARATADGSPAARLESAGRGAPLGAGDASGPARPGRTSSPRREGGAAPGRRPRRAGGERSPAALQGGPSGGDAAETPTYSAAVPTYSHTLPAGGGSAGGNSGAGDAGGGKTGGGRSDVDRPQLLDTSGDDRAETPGGGGEKRRDAEKRNGREHTAGRPHPDAREVGRARGQAPRERRLPQAERPRAERAPAAPPRARPPQVEVPLPPDHAGGPPVQPGVPPDHAGGPPDQAGGPPDQAGGPPDHAGGPPDQPGGPPDQAGGPPDQAGGPPDQAGGPPDQAGGPPDQPGGPPDQLPPSQGS